MSDHSSSPLVLRELRDSVLILTMNNPKRLNGWTMEMMEELKDAFQEANEHPEVKGIILTGAGRYYSAGVNLGGTLKLGHPRALHQGIVAHNQALFDAFLDVDKPILIAMNGPAIGASVTAATLCDGIIAAEEATFSTPFAALGIPPEGCSSIHFARLMGEDNASRMLGSEGWKPTADEAREVGLIQWVTPAETLVEEAEKIVRQWVGEGKVRQFRGGSERGELKEVNARESIALADAFLAAPFIRGQLQFLWKKKKFAPALTFAGLLFTRPIWARFL